MKPFAANDREECDGQARQWIVRLASGDATVDDLAHLQVWLDAADRHRAAFRRERQSWYDLAAVEDAFGEPEEIAPARRRRVGPRAVGLAIAASIAGILAMPTVLLSLRADYRSPGSEIRAITLADGSRAVLDADSALAVDFGSRERAVTLLRGRAWFDVRHGDARPFRVLAGDGTTQDVGTAFEVERGLGDVHVGVTQGAVRVTGAGGASLLLHAGDRAHYGTGRAMRDSREIDPGAMAGWSRGELLLRALPVKAAIAEIARYRSAPVFVWGDLSNTAPVSGSFRTDQPDDALATLVVMRRLEQLRLPGGVLILRESPQN